jgi:hypothetical protein
MRFRLIYDKLSALFMQLIPLEVVHCVLSPLLDGTVPFLEGSMMALFYGFLLSVLVRVNWVAPYQSLPRLSLHRHQRQLLIARA